MSDVAMENCQYCLIKTRSGEDVMHLANMRSYVVMPLEDYYLQKGWWWHFRSRNKWLFGDIKWWER